MFFYNPSLKAGVKQSSYDARALALIRFIASSNFETGAHKLTLTYLSPASPKIPPGVINTFELDNTSSLNSKPVLYFEGILAHTNMPACSIEYLHSKRSSNSNTFFLRSLYTLFTSSYHSFPRPSAFAEANCTGRNIPLSILLLNRSTSSILFFAPQSIPTLHPAMFCDLLREFNSITHSFAPSTLNKLIGFSPDSHRGRIKLYGLS